MIDVRWHEALQTLGVMPNSKVRNAKFKDGYIWLFMDDGSAIRVSLDRIPGVRQAHAAERHSYELSDDGLTLHWPSLSETLSIRELMGRPH